ncbi:MAG: hypothetical protein ACFFAG_06530 [Promethearchaeota archaeon]
MRTVDLGEQIIRNLQCLWVEAFIDRPYLVIPPNYKNTYRHDI